MEILRAFAAGDELTFTFASTTATVCSHERAKACLLSYHGEVPSVDQVSKVKTCFCTAINLAHNTANVCVVSMPLYKWTVLHSSKYTKSLLHQDKSRKLTPRAPPFLEIPQFHTNTHFQSSLYSSPQCPTPIPPYPPTARTLSTSTTASASSRPSPTSTTAFCSRTRSSKSICRQRRVDRGDASTRLGARFRAAA
jgi:hypothetical protein